MSEKKIELPPELKFRIAMFKERLTLFLKFIDLLVEMFPNVPRELMDEIWVLAEKLHKELNVFDVNSFIHELRSRVFAAWQELGR